MQCKQRLMCDVKPIFADNYVTKIKNTSFWLMNEDNLSIVCFWQITTLPKYQMSDFG